MINFVTEKVDFLKYKKRFSTLFNINREFEDNIFKDTFKYFISFDFDYIFDEEFFNLIKFFLKEVKIEEIDFYSIKPSSEEYFLKNFRKYGVFKTTINNSYKDFYNIIYEDVDDKGSGNYLGVVCDEIAWYSDSDDWAIAGSRDLEIGIVGFSNRETKEKLLKCFEGTEILMPIKDYILMLDKQLNFSEKRWLYYNKVIDNYKNRG